ncbi:polyketide synthase dehydratase domain-containing protein, partial [Streptomyces sp. NPDC044780]
PITLTHPTTIQITINPPDDTTIRTLTIHTRTDPDQPWIQHATGTLAQRRHTPRTPETWPPTNAEPIPLHDTYHHLATTGLEYGPAFQGLQALWRQDNRLLADVHLPEDAGDTDGYGIHPALLDAALHALVADSDGDEIRLPFAWTGVTLHATGATHLRVTLETDDTGTVSLSATDTSGQPVVTVDSLTTRPIDPAQLRARPRGADDLYALDWLPWSSGGTATTVDFERYVVPVVGDDVVADTHRITTETLAHVQHHLAHDTTTPLVVEATHDDLAGAAVWGLLRTAQTEHPNRIILIDTDDHPASREILPALVASGEPQARIIDGTVTVPRLTTTAAT